MGKIKLNLISGAVVEKPLINAFSINSNTYVVLDNEINGSMGLPIILVSKYENNKLTKILDQNEWQNVKEYLKSIIAGGQVEFIKISESINADDIYYTQLTLPVPSFDALKKAYHVEDANDGANVSVNLNPLDVTVGNNMNTEVVNPVENVQPANVSNDEIPVSPFGNDIKIQSEAPVVDNVVTEATPQLSPFSISTSNVVGEPVVEPSVNTSEIDLSTPMPTLEDNVSVPEQNVVNDVEPEITPTPIIDANINSQPELNDLFKDQKEAFMQACENMFDALVQKFQKELDNRK